MWRLRRNLPLCARRKASRSEFAVPAVGNPNKLRTEAESGILRWETTRFQSPGYQCWRQRWLTRCEASPSTISLKHSPHRRQIWNPRKNSANQQEGQLLNLASSRSVWIKQEAGELRGLFLRR